MTLKVRNPRSPNPSSYIDCEVLYQGQWLPHTCMPNTDTEETYQRIINGEAGEILITEEPVIEAVVPESVGPLQIRRAIRQLGMMGQMKSFLKTADEEIVEAWEYATEFKRRDHLILQAQQQLNKTDSELDQLFILASEL